MSITPTRSSPSAQLSLSSSRARSQRRVLRRTRKLVNDINSTPNTNNNNDNNDKNVGRGVNNVRSDSINSTQNQIPYQSTHPTSKGQHVHTVKVPSTTNNTSTTTTTAMKNLTSSSSSINQVNRNNSRSNNNSSSIKKDAPLQPPLSSKQSMPSSPSQLSSSSPSQSLQKQFTNTSPFTKSNKNDMPNNSKSLQSNMFTVSDVDEMSRTRLTHSSQQMQSRQQQLQQQQQTDLPSNSLTQSTIDREMFSSVNFSSALFVNNVVNKVLYPVVQKNRSVGNKRVASHVLSTLHSSPLTPSLKNSDNNNNNLNNSFSLSSEAIDYRQVANQLSLTVQRAERQVAKLLHSQEAELHQMQLRSRRIEIYEKRQLARIRLGLQSTTSKLMSYEHRVHNAQSATTGIEQHLAQSNARVERGKSIAQLLRFFKMFIAITPKTLSGILKKMSIARQAQRLATTAAWEAGQVSHYNPQYFSTPQIRTVNKTRSRSSPVGQTSITLKQNNQTHNKAQNDKIKISTETATAIYTQNKNMYNYVKNANQEEKDKFTQRRRSGSRPRPRVLRRQRRAQPMPLNSNSNMTSTSNSPQQLHLQQTNNNNNNRANHRSSSMLSSLAPHNNVKNNAQLQQFQFQQSKKGQEQIDSNEISSLSLSSQSTSRLHPLEAQAIAAGLDRAFVMRSLTELQVQ